MCIVSMAGDYWRDRVIPQKYPDWSSFPVHIPQVSREEFESLKADIQELKELLLASKKFDEAVGEPDCEVEEKVEFIKKMAEYLGVDMKDVF